MHTKYKRSYINAPYVKFRNVFDMFYLIDTYQLICHDAIYRDYFKTMIFVICVFQKLLPNCYP